MNDTHWLEDWGDKALEVASAVAIGNLRKEQSVKAAQTAQTVNAPKGPWYSSPFVIVGGLVALVVVVLAFRK